MNKKELVQAIADKTGKTQVVTTEIIDAFVVVVTEQLAKQESVQLVGFGSFETVSRSERTGRNPKTGEEIQIPAAIIPKFKPGKGLKDAIPQPKAKKTKKAK